MKTLYLYIKESPLGIKYLGKTEQDPFTYTGSGKYWKRHLKAHDFTIKDIKTTVLFETTDKNELINKGVYYSELYDIVSSEDWANLKPETGDGGGGKKNEKEKLKISSTMKRRKLIWTDDDIKKRNEKLKGRKMPPCKEETKKKISEANKGRVLGIRTEESYIKANETKKKNGYKHSEETKLKIRQTLKGNKRPKEVVDKLGKKILVDDVLYSSMSEAERVLCKSRYMINKQHKIKLL
jgi:NUMOD3 motif